MIVYTGILPVCANEAGLAALMSHQISHDMARHRTERLAATMNTGGQPTGYAGQSFQFQK